MMDTYKKDKAAEKAKAHKASMEVEKKVVTKAAPAKVATKTAAKKK